MRRATWIQTLAFSSAASVLWLPSTWCQTNLDMTGRPLDISPFFVPVQSVHLGDPVRLVIGPGLVLPYTVCDIYLTEDLSFSAWSDNPQLVDVRPEGPQIWVAGSNLLENAVDLTDMDNLATNTGTRPGKAYDVVIDVNQNGELDEGDLVDGWQGPGIHLLGDWGETGPHPVSVFEHEVSFWQTMRVHHPSDWLEVEMVPLVVISHGWTHEYTFYDDLASHLASYGYVVMSHRNDVGNGGAAASTTASTTALENIDAFWADVDAMGGGVLAGRVDAHRIVHAGHSTGGECVVRAHVRLANGDYLSPYVQSDDFVLLQGLAPVAFLEADLASPLEVPYHHVFPAADTDVTGNASDGYVQGMAIFERGMGPKYATFIHGSGHNDLHDNPGPSLASGPNLVGKEATHDVLKPLFLALSELHAWNNPAGLDYFVRNRQEFHPLSMGDTLSVSGEMIEGAENRIVLDDFETSPNLGVASCGATVTYSEVLLHEVVMSDTDGSFEFTGENWANGMCRSRVNDQPKCGTLAWDSDGEWCLEFDEPSSWENATAFRFRAAALTRHPLNGEDDLVLEVSLEDDAGHAVTMSSSWWGGIAPPYPRSGGGAYSACLPSGAYTLTVGGSTWPEEQLVTIPGVLSEVGFGSTSFLWEADGPCDSLQVLCYDSYGDGWDSGTFTLENASGQVVLEGTLNDGFDPDLGQGWQNEFHTLSFPLVLVPLLDSEFNLHAVAKACLRVGPSHGSAQGAIGFDDVHLTSPPGSIVPVEEAAHRLSIDIVPNPTSDAVLISKSPVQEPFKLIVRSLDGREMWRSSSASSLHRVETSHWPSGIYVVDFQDSEFRSTEKLLVQH